MKMTRDNFAALLTPVHRKIYFESYAEVPQQYTRIFDTMDMTKKDETMVHEGAFGPWVENTEGNTINQDSITEGPTVTFTARRFDKGYDVTWELTQDDLYGVWAGKGKGGSAQGLGRTLRLTEEIDAAAVLNGGFSNTGYDGAALFSNSHTLESTTSVGDNLVTGGLSDSTLKAALIQCRKTPDEAGYNIFATPGQLIIPIDLEYTAKTILQSMGPAGVISNDKNVIPSLELVVMDQLSSATAWFIRAKNIENLKFMWRERPIFDSQKIQKTVDHFFYGYARWDCGYSDWRGLVGSAG